MSRRTSESSKAVAAAWAYEQQLVSEGMGTRDWTKEQQQDILEKGKAYDDNGKAFEGHHMKSAEMYPKYQGESQNIQFLTRKEHFEAHSCNFKNSTNGFYDPITKLTMEFSEEGIERCTVIELTEPVIKFQVLISDQENALIEENSSPNSQFIEQIDIKKKIDNNSDKKGNTVAYKNKFVNHKRVGRIRNLWGNTVKAVFEFVTAHPIITTLVVTSIGAGIDVLATRGVSGRRISDNRNVLQKQSRCEMFDSVSDDYENVDSGASVRSSPQEHIVDRHKQRYHTKNGVIEREKESYLRGGNKK